MDIHGPPGTGKSLAVADWVQRGVASGMATTWVACESLTLQSSVIIASKRVLVSACININRFPDVILNLNLGFLTVADGVKKAHTEICGMVKEWSEKYRKCAILIRSENSKPTNGALVERVRSWQRADYEHALSIKQFRESVYKLFRDDEAFHLLFGNEMIDEEEVLRKCIDAKIHVAGGSARFMFALSTESAKRVIDDKMNIVLENINDQEYHAAAFEAINTIFTRDLQGRRIFISNYAQSRFVDLRGVDYYRENWPMISSLGNAVVGAFFESAILKIVRESVFINVQSPDGLDYIWKIKEFKEFMRIRALDVSDCFRNIIQLGLVTTKESNFICPFKPCKQSKFTHFNNLDIHIQECHKLKAF